MSGQKAGTGGSPKARENMRKRRAAGNSKEALEWWAPRALKIEEAMEIVHISRGELRDLLPKKGLRPPEKEQFRKIITGRYRPDNAGTFIRVCAQIFAERDPREKALDENGWFRFIEPLTHSEVVLGSSQRPYPRVLSEVLGGEDLQGLKKSYLVEDETVCFYNNRSGFELVDIRFPYEMHPMPVLESPTKEQLTSHLNWYRDRRLYSEAVFAYLDALAADPPIDPTEYNWRAGVNAFALPAPGQNQVLTLSIIPLTWWEDYFFTRAIAVEDNQVLRGIAGDVWRNFIKRSYKHYFKFDFPSILYLELTLVTRDGHVLLLNKHPKYSHFREQWCCSIQQHVKWESVVGRDRLDVESTILDALKRDLKLTEHVVHWKLLGVGLQAHLNTTLFGYVELNLDSPTGTSSSPFLDDGRKEMIESPISPVEDRQFHGYEFVRLDNIERMEELQNRRVLHPSALLRFQLARQYHERYRIRG